MKVLIYLKGGAVVDLEMEKFTTRGTGDGLSKLDWVTPEGASKKLHHINLGEIAAIVVDQTGEQPE